jgi:hypothetical protein
MLSSIRKSLRHHLPEASISAARQSFSHPTRAHAAMCAELSELQNVYGLVLGVLSFAVTGCVFEGSTAGQGHGK